MPPVPHGWRTTRVTLEAAVDSVGPSTGYPVETFAALGDVWAARLASTTPANEVIQADQLVARVAADWRIPYRPDMDPELVDVPKLRRLLVHGRALDIVDATLVRVGGRRLEIALMTREKVTGA